MLNLKFCPSCGNKSLNFNGKTMNCQKCDFTFYNNTAAAVAVVIIRRDEILFTRRNQNPELGKLDLAGGFIDFEETAENACKRELWEELHLNIDKNRLKYICSLPNTYLYKEIIYHTIDLFFEYKIENKPNFIVEKHEISESVWVKISDINIDELAFKSQKHFFKGYIKNFKKIA